MLIDGYDALLCDLDGVVYAGAGAIAGATEALDRLPAAGVRLGYITNNASRSSEQVAAHPRAEVAFAEFTSEGVVRHASFIGLRGDKPASEVVRELESPVVVDPPAHNIKITNPERIIDPGSNVCISAGW